MKAQISAFFRGLPLTVYAVVGVLAAAGGWLALNNAKQRAVGAEQVLTAQATYQRDSLSKVLKGKEAQFRRDTVRIFRSVETIDTLIQHRIDTAIVRQTDTVKITVREATAIQDTLRTCREGVRSCADIQRDLRGMLKADSAIIKSLRAQKPLRQRLLGRCGVIVGVGGVRSGNQVYAGPAVTLGCRAFP